MNKQHVSILFNVALSLYLLIGKMTKYAFNPTSQAKVPWDIVYEWSKSLAIVLAIVIVITMIVVGSALFRLFWNKFISDVFKLRSISLNEAIAIILLFAIVTG